MPTSPRDPNQLAKLIVDIATGEAEDSVSPKKRQPSPKRNGGLKGGKARAKALTDAERADIARLADVWTWTAIDADTKLCVGYLVGGRDGWWATEFMQDIASRIRGRVQL